ncbi:ABC transporter ATP-binding protein [Oceanotoga teriensis]|uniref:Peptide/nickel transport system ATP-binding protein n=1 Tax=Oceanotoga teriensis TaxID=515440 RepID=A0AA45HHT2_9BACT|nr:ABC transporter ATP-binding protein [Oceanotoga teriensis]MDO7976557.1 ABC transporter ATP-binding protein [Oceanotoga teriensis]PWJ88276.1 peptide/nickel transport system ATP-binding protein [Oceanotoga teriensis]
MELLSLENISIGFKNKNYLSSAVKNISFKIKKGEILGIVGESGCGKSITSLSIIGLLPDNAVITSGKLIFDNKNLLSLKNKERIKMMGEKISMIFQEPMVSLNPLMKIGKQIEENIVQHRIIDKKTLKEETLNLLKSTGIPDVESSYNKYPHELSGGQRQRVIIAIAIANQPDLIIADEPTTALDVTIQAQIIDLLKNINKSRESSILFVSHDIGVIDEICDSVVVMYFGEIIEKGSKKEIINNPKHPYTEGLLKCLPSDDLRGKKLYNIKGKVPDINSKIEGCPFKDRCDFVMDICKIENPKEFKINEEHYVKCHKVINNG